MHVFHQNFFYQVLLIMFRFLFSCYSHCFDILLACNISSMSHFASLLEHCQCYPREDVFPIFSLGSVREIHSLGKYFSVHSLGHSEYQEIHTFSALNIDSVKINTSLLMMKECIRTLPRGGMYWVVHPRRPRDFPRPERCPEGEARGTSRGPREISRSEGMYNPIHPDSRQCTAILSSLIHP